MTTIRHLSIEELMDVPIKACGPGVLGKPLESEFWGTHFIEQKGIDWNHKKRVVLDKQFSQLDKAKWVVEHPKSEPYIPFPRRCGSPCECFGCRGAPGAKHEFPLMYATKDLLMLEQELAMVLAKEAEAKERRELKKARKETQK